MDVTFQADAVCSRLELPMMIALTIEHTIENTIETRPQLENECIVSSSIHTESRTRFRKINLPSHNFPMNIVASNPPPPPSFHPPPTPYQRTSEGHGACVRACVRACVYVRARVSLTPSLCTRFNTTAMLWVCLLCIEPNTLCCACASVVRFFHTFTFFLGCAQNFARLTSPCER